MHQNRAILCGCGGDFDRSPKIARFFEAPRCAISSAKKTASKPRSLLRMKWVKIQKNSRRLELSISENTPHGRWGQGPGSVGPRFPAGLPFPVPEILEFVAFRGSGKFFQQFSRDFPGVFPENPRTDPGNSHSLLEFSEKWSSLRNALRYPPLRRKSLANGDARFWCTQIGCTKIIMGFDKGPFRPPKIPWMCTKQSLNLKDS